MLYPTSNSEFILDQIGIFEMSSIENIKYAIEAYLDRKETPYAIMIDGDWGVGKTHLFKTEIVPVIGEGECIYISLFGLKTIQEIENEIFKTISCVGNDEDGFFKDLLNSNTEMIEDVKIGGLGYVVQFGLKKWKTTKLKQSKALTLCFDDIERWEGDIGICLSYINKIVEHENGKCIIIGSLDQVKIENRKGFLNAKEKTIRHIYKLETNPKEVIKSSLYLVDFNNVESEQYIKQLIAVNESRIVDILEKSDYRNVRVVSDSIQLLDYIYCKNEDKFIVSKASAISYYCCLLSALILLRKYILDADLQRKIINHGDSESYGLFNEIGYFEKETPPEYINSKSKYLLGRTFSSDPKMSLEGIFSIIKNGFYCEEDFDNNFSFWRETQAYEYYLDTFTYWYKGNAEAEKIFRETFKQIFEEKVVKNPVTLLIVTDRLTGDIKRGILDLDFDKTKDKIISLFNFLYDENLMERSQSVKIHYGPNKFEYSKDIFHFVCERHEQYMNSTDEPVSRDFWLLLKNDPENWDELFHKYQAKPIFTFFENPTEIVDALEQLKNSDLFELTRSLGSRISDPNCTEAVSLESQNSGGLVEAITDKYSQVFNVRGGHFKQIARIIKNRSTEYDPEYENKE